MERQIINPWTWQDQFGFVQAHALTGGRTIHCAGQTSVDADGNPVHAGDMVAQVRQSLESLEVVLRESGCGLSDVVRLNYYTTDVDGFFPAMMEVQGQKGGPMEPISGLISSWLPASSASIGVQEEDETITIGVGEEGEVKSQLLRDPEGNGFTMRGGGFIMGLGLEQAELAPSDARWSDPDLPEQSVEMKSGARGAFSWSG